MTTRTVGMEPLLFAAPVVAGLLASSDVLSAQAAFAAAGLAALGVDVACRVIGRAQRRGLPRRRVVVASLAVPALAAAVGAGLLAVAPAVTGLGHGLVVAGQTVLVMALALVCPGLPTPAGRLAVEAITRNHDRVRPADVSRGIAWRTVAWAMVVSFAGGPRIAAAVAVGAVALIVAVERDIHASHRDTDADRFVAEIAGPVVAVGSDRLSRDDRDRLAAVGAGYLRRGDDVRLVHAQDVPVDADGRCLWERARSIATLDGATPLAKLDDALDDAPEALVVVGDLVIGVVTRADTRRTSDRNAESGQAWRPHRM